ncbi:MAG: tRNA (guanosine(37)-N1)-methyltransferase TrmD, partial [Candidatus Roizmanbacteria bacterium]
VYNRGMKITVLTLFPKMIAGFIQESIIKRAQEKGLVEISIVDIRDFAEGTHKSVDDRPYGGGAGMVMRVDVVERAINSVLSPESSVGSQKRRIILTSPRGRAFGQKMAEELSKLEDVIIIAGHYEGVDERVVDLIDEEVSIGDFVLTGGELPAAVILDSVVRLIPGVLKKEDATSHETFGEVSVKDLQKAVGNHEVVLGLLKKGIEKVRLLEYPHYSRPQEYNGVSVPDVLIGGNHKDIQTWKLQRSFSLTLKNRPDLLGL